MSDGSAHLVMGSVGGFCLLTAGLDPTAELFMLIMCSRRRNFYCNTPNTHGDGVSGNRLAP